jgi:hypothetical protein
MNVSCLQFFGDKTGKKLGKINDFHSWFRHNVIVTIMIKIIFQVFSSLVSFLRDEIIKVIQNGKQIYQKRKTHKKAASEWWWNRQKTEQHDLNKND